MSKPVLITKNQCPNCNAAKNKLSKEGIEVEVRNVSIDPAAAQLATDLALVSAPALIVDDTVLRTMGEILSWIKMQRN